MAHSRKRAAPRQRATLSHNIHMQLTSYKMEDSSSPTLRQVPIGVIRLATRFGLSVSAAQAIAQANSWGGR